MEKQSLYNEVDSLTSCAQWHEDYVARWDAAFGAGHENAELEKWLVNNGFFEAPASTKYHGAYPGGLYRHSACVADWLQDITDKMGYEWQRPESPFIVGMFHDLCKIDQYRRGQAQASASFGGHDVAVYGAQAPAYEYNDKQLLAGHGAKSVMLLSQFMTLTEEEILAIRYHMGAYEKDDWTGFDLAIRKYPAVLWTHTADMLASKVDGE